MTPVGTNQVFRRAVKKLVRSPMELARLLCAVGVMCDVGGCETVFLRFVPRVATLLMLAGKIGEHATLSNLLDQS